MELRNIELSKQTFMRNNCYDIERVYFELDQARKGYFCLNDLKIYMMQNGVKVQPKHTSDLNLLMNYFDRRSVGRVSFEDFTDVFI